MDMPQYTDEDLLMLSGIQHIAFCERQYALAYIEMQWSENKLTIEGKFMHERVDDPFIITSKPGIITLRSVSLVSHTLGLTGIADVVELWSTDNKENSIQHSRFPGRWNPVPVEYKRGKPKPDACDEIQLCAQAICLEEMNSVQINTGYIYYGETRHRHEVELTSGLRQLVETYALHMHELFSKNITPLPEYKPCCKSCSLIDICLPKSITKNKSANKYNASLEYD